jgi:tetratricopeptide (TPR) repeat protein
LASRLSDLKVRVADTEKLHLQTLAAVNELLKEFPKSPEYVEMSGHTYRYLGWIARDTGRPAEALEDFDKAVSAFQQLADADIPQRHGFYRDFLAGSLLQEVNILARVGRPDDAEKTIRRVVEMYESLIRDYPDNSKWHQKGAGAVSVLADLLIKNGRRQDAAEVYLAALARLEELADGPQVQIYRGTLHRDSGELDQAIADCSAAIAGEPGMVEAFDLRGSCYLRKSEFAKSAEDYSEAIKLQPGNSWYWHERAFAYMALGKHRESITDHSEAIRLSDQDAGTRLRRGDCYRALGEWTKAETDYTRAIELDSGVWEAWHGRGLTYLQLKQNDKATSDFTKAIELKPDRGEAWSGRAFAYFHRQQWYKAVSDFSKAIDLAPHVHTNWFHRGHAYLNLTQWDNAAADFAKVVEQWPDDPGGWYYRGVAYAQLNQADKALADLDQAIAKGFKGELIKNDPRLAPLRSNDDFKKLLTKFEKEKK